jgi:short-subunit dehydrogenase
MYKLQLRVYLVGPLQAVKDQLSSTCKDIEVLPLDLCGPYAGLEAAAAAADAAFGGSGVDYLVHNAGASQSALASEVSPGVTDAMFGVNTLGPIKLTRAALPSLLSRNKGRIVVVASMAAKVPSPGQAVYSGVCVCVCVCVYVCVCGRAAVRPGW